MVVESQLNFMSGRLYVRSLWGLLTLKRGMPYPDCAGVISLITTFFAATINRSSRQSRPPRWSIERTQVSSLLLAWSLSRPYDLVILGYKFTIKTSVWETFVLSQTCLLFQYIKYYTSNWREGSIWTER